MVEPAGDQSHAARPNAHAVARTCELAREGLRDSSSLEEKKNAGLNSQSALLGRPRDSAADEVCVSRRRPGGSVCAPRPPAAKSVGRPPILIVPLFPTHFPTRRPGAVLRARGSVWTARVPRSVARRRRPGPAAKSVGRPLSLLLQVLPHFSPLSALGAQGPC